MGNFHGKAQPVFVLPQLRPGGLPRADIARGNGNAIAHSHDLLAQPGRFDLRRIDEELFLQRRARGCHGDELVEKAERAVHGQQHAQLLPDDLTPRQAQYPLGGSIDFGDLEIRYGAVGSAPALEEQQSIQIGFGGGAEELLGLPALGDIACGVE